MLHDIQCKIGVNDKNPKLETKPGKNSNSNKIK